MRTAQTIFVAMCVLAAAAGPVPAGAEIPRAEHPRPDMRRPTWQNLNGTWQFCFDPGDRGLDERWPLGGGPLDRTITVPFPWQSDLSGIADRSGQRIGWYRRTIAVPEAWRGGRVWLCFGAVRHEARVWVDGRAVGRHEGGNTPFAMDITEVAPPGTEVRLDVRVADLPDAGLPAVGGDPRDGFPRSSGMWQTVWLESRGPVHIDGLRLTPSRPGGNWILEVEVELAGPDGPVRVTARSPDAAVGPRSASARLEQGHGAARLLLEIGGAKPWSPDEPHLYDLEVSAVGPGGQHDVVQTYFGLRTVTRGRYAGLDHEGILLNGEPVYLRGARDPSLNPEGLATAPDDAFLRRDMELARQLGLNLLKITGKPEPRRLYWADKLGVLLWQEMPAAKLDTERSREAWWAAVRGVIRRDRNHPSLIGWTLLGDTQRLGGQPFQDDRAAQRWVYERVGEVRGRLDPSRLVEDIAAPRSGHVETDVLSWHFHIDDYWIAREHISQVVERTRPGATWGYVPGIVQGTAPLVCGHFSAVPAEGGDVSWALRFLVTQLRRHSRIGGHVLSAFYDLPPRRDGLLHFDRSAKEFGYDAFLPGMSPADLHRADFVGFDSPPIIEASPGEELTLALFASHYSARRRPARLRWQIVGIDGLGRPVAGAAEQRDVSWQRGEVTFQLPLRVWVPEAGPFVGALTAELLDVEGRRIAANYVNLIVGQSEEGEFDEEPARAAPPWPSVEVLAPRLVAVRIPPGEFASLRADGVDSDAPGAGSEFFAARGLFASGHCEVEYRVALPGFVREAIPAQVVLMAEMAGGLDAGRPPNAGSSAGQAGSVSVSIWDHQLWQILVPAAPADSRGVLSHHARFRQGSYGNLVRRRADLTRLPQLREDMFQKEWFPLVFRTEGSQMGLAIFGRELGQTMVDPTLVIQTAKQLSRPVGFVSYDPVTIDRLMDQGPPPGSVQTTSAR